MSASSWVTTPALGETSARFWRSLAAVAIALGIAAAIVVAFNASPITAAETIWNGSLGSSGNLGVTITVATPLVLTGLAAAIPFSAGQWNVGGEGQLLVGAVAATVVTLEFSSAGWALIPLGVAAGILGGALWGLIPALLRVRLGISEVISSLMLNFVAVLFVGYAVRDIWSQPLGTQTRDIPDAANLPTIWTGGNVHLGIVLAVVATLACAIMLARLRLGFALRAVGASQRASALSGFRVGALSVSGFVIGAACGGLAGAIEVLGTDHALVYGATVNFGYIGIAIALVAALRPLVVLPVAFIFATLQVGSQALPATTSLPASLGQVLIAVFVLSVLAMRAVDMRRSPGGFA